MAVIIALQNEPFFVISNWNTFSVRTYLAHAKENKHFENKRGIQLKKIKTWRTRFQDFISKSLS